MLNLSNPTIDIPMKIRGTLFVIRFRTEALRVPAQKYFRLVRSSFLTEGDDITILPGDNESAIVEFLEASLDSIRDKDGNLTEPHVAVVINTEDNKPPEIEQDRKLVLKELTKPGALNVSLQILAQLFSCEEVVTPEVEQAEESGGFLEALSQFEPAFEVPTGFDFNDQAVLKTQLKVRLRPMSTQHRQRYQKARPVSTRRKGRTMSQKENPSEIAAIFQDRVIGIDGAQFLNGSDESGVLIVDCAEHNSDAWVPLVPYHFMRFALQQEAIQVEAGN